MKPACSVTANINIAARYYFCLFSRLQIELRPTRSLVISSHKLWLAMLSFSFFCGLAQGTSIVFLVTQERIMIASDGVVTEKTNDKTSFRKFCKIRTGRKVYYAIAGEYGVAGTDLDVWKIAGDSVTKSPTFTGILDLIEPAILERLKAVADRNKLSDPESYAKWISGEAVIEMAFASFEAGPTVVGLSFYIDGNGNPVSPAQRDVVRPAVGKIFSGALGQHREIDAILPTQIWQKSYIANSIDASRYLIQREIDASTRDKRFDVGLPISIAMITAGTAGFVKDNEGACPSK